MRKSLLSLVVCFYPALALAAVQNPPAAPLQNLPGDKPRQHEEQVTKAIHDYAIDFTGKIDGVMTRMPISYKPYVQGWQPNVSARIENIGDSDVVNPWIIVNDRGDWRTIKGIVEAATGGLTSDADKARALWHWQCNHRFHATTWDNELLDVVKALNVYGYTLCGDEAHCLKDLWKSAGFKARPGRPVGHVVFEVFYDDAWHLLDSDESVLPLKRDNRTVASETEVVRDHDLMKRTHTYGISAREDAMTDQFSVSLYGHEGDRSGEGTVNTRHKMDFTLRPGESIEWRWNHVGKEYSAGTPLKDGEAWRTDGTGSLGAWGPGALANLRNGKWIYRPMQKPERLTKGLVSGDNVICALGSVSPNDNTKPALLVWKIATPYVMVGGSASLQFPLNAAPVKIRFSRDAQTWQDVAPTVEKPQPGRSVVIFDKLLSPRKQPMYAYYVQAEIPPGSSLESIEFDTDLQMSLLAMPELTVGQNRIKYTDDSTTDRKVKITHNWIERTEWQPPAAVTQALAPKDGQTVAGSKLTFRWSPPAVTQGAVAIADYHFQLCERQDMRWPLSPTFDKVISLSPSRGKPEWMIPYPGLLNPDTDYYWRVRAKDANGVWGPWSSAFRFRVAAPGLPVNLKLVMDGAMPKSITWEDSPGAKAVAWRIYGSNEQGFTASDSEYVLRAGNGFCKTMADFNTKPKTDPFYGDVKTPANFLTQVTQRQYDLPAGGPLFAFYRVVAVDEQKTQGVASDYIPLPRPYIYSTPPASAKAGQPYTYTPAAVASIGHLTCRDGYNAAFWQKEDLTWTLTGGPAWLTIKDNTLTGTPPANDLGLGEWTIVLKVTNTRNQSHEQSFRIAVKE